jgi:ubiquitin-conjugating enzyme E2 M
MLQPTNEDPFNYQFSICPDSGYYNNMPIIFDLQFSFDYPYLPPKVRCLTNVTKIFFSKLYEPHLVLKIFHPNIDAKGHVCLNILRLDWKPVLTMNSILFGLLHLLLEPTIDDPLNQSIYSR